MIRQLHAADASLYRNVRLDALRHEPQAFISTFQSESQKAELFLERCLKTEDTLNIVFGAFSNERLVGIAGFVKEQGEIIQLYVDQESRGCGLGRELLTALLDAAFSRFPDLEVIQISVLLTLRNAAELYQSLGFETCGQDAAAGIKNDYSYDLLHLKISRTTWNRLMN